MSAPRRNVSYIKPGDPSFLKAFKEKAGYKEPEVTIDTKRAINQEARRDGTRDDEPYREDEQPMVVLMKESNVSQDEYRQFIEDQKIKETTVTRESKVGQGQTSLTDEGGGGGGKIVFKKPIKRTSSEASNFHSSSSKKKAIEKDCQDKESSSTNSVNNMSLLSFDNEQDDDDDDDDN